VKSLFKLPAPLANQHPDRLEDLQNAVTNTLERNLVERA
jgi:hypothetical protein